MTCLAEDSGKLQDYPAPHPPFRVPVWAVGGLLYIFFVVVVVQLSRCQAGLDLGNGAVDITLFFPSLLNHLQPSISAFHLLWILALSYRRCLNSSCPSLPSSFPIFVVTSVATNPSSCRRLPFVYAQLFGACRSSLLNPIFTLDVLTISTCICSRHQLWNSPKGYTYLWTIFLILMLRKSLRRSTISQLTAAAIFLRSPLSSVTLPPSPHNYYPSFLW